MFSLKFSAFLYLSEDNNSHQSFPSAPSKAATFIDRHKVIIVLHTGVTKETYGNVKYTFYFDYYVSEPFNITPMTSWLGV